MSEIERWEGGGALAAPAPSTAMRLVDWAAEASAAYQLAERLVVTAFCPEGFRGKPGDAAAAILAGGEVGLSPLAALNSFDVIQGRAAPGAKTLRALVQAQGHEIVLVESTASICRMKGRRRGSQEWQEVRWTLERAQQLGVTGKDNWKKQAQAMLVARATSELCRLIASDAILGIPYTLEELADGDGAADKGEPRKRSMSRQPKPPTEEGPSEQQSKMMHALLGEAGLTERDAYLARVSEIVGRDVESTSDLTRAEVSQVIDALQGDVDPGQAAAESVPATERQVSDIVTKVRTLELSAPAAKAMIARVTGREAARTDNLTAAEADAVLAELATLDQPAPVTEPPADEPPPVATDADGARAALRAAQEQQGVLGEEG